MTEFCQCSASRNRLPHARLGASALAALAALAVSLGVATRASAQADTNPLMPNVLLLVDTSGSMEYKTSSNTFPVCRFDTNGLIPNPPTLSEKSRWTDMVEVLTGSIANYDCQTIDRGLASFKAEYKVNSTLANSPYDFLYPNPYHRPMSGTCVAGPGTINALNPADFPSNSFNYHAYNNVNSSCTYVQTPDGILDGFQDTIRFALMTFDTDPSPDQGELGTYSYVVGTSHTGLPAGCTTPSAMEVGARNASAPPWEGRLIPFGDPSPGSSDYRTKSVQIKQVLRATRPFGATPIAGMLSDARDFLWNDHTNDLVNTTQRFGPADDPYAACRATSVVLLSDGQPNMDLRGHCNGSDCPFPLPEQIAASLLLGSGVHGPVKTSVIGFALNTLTVAGSSVDCSLLKPADLDSTPGSLCSANADNASLQACCNLARIAFAGDNTPGARAFFASNRDELRGDIASVLHGSSTPTSRTQPVFSASPATVSPTTFAASYRFLSQFTPAGLEPWAGLLTRERWVCDAQTKVAKAADLDPNKGDSFDQNLISGQGRARTFYTVQATPVGSNVFSDRTIRPNLTSNVDGVSAQSGTFSAGDTKTAFVSNTSPASMGLTDTSCTVTTNGVTTNLTAQQCRDRYLKWLVGDPNGTNFSRCPSQKVCSLIGDIFHSTPRVVPPPSELTRDESYQAFQNTYLTRPLMLYTSSNDGFLHAFKVASNVPNDAEDIQTKKNNELWALMPPQVLPHVSSQYPFSHQLLLDGMPVVKDVVARKTSGTYPYVFERTTADAIAGASPNVTWRTILLQSFGAGYPGYFAVDITNPDPTMTINTEAGGPKFLWQVTTDDAGNPLFGIGGGTPIISTLLFDDDGTGAREIPVAILPGGPGGPGGSLPGDPNTGCPRASQDFAKFATSNYLPRTSVPCYTNNLGARSLTIVRLDTGKIVRTFRRAKSELPAAIQPRVLVAPLDSPITGEPIAFPADVGAVADRVFVGDQDGSLWKADLSNTSPDLWTMSLFWDAFPSAPQIHGQTGLWNNGQPIATAPVISVDTSNNITLAVATGDQTALGAAPNMINYLWSLRDLPNTATPPVFSPDLLWVQQFTGGERVTGPISLFNSYLYFTSVTPPADNAVCATGNANVWGMHYLLPKDGVGTIAQPSDKTVGGLAAPFLSTDFHLTTQFVPSTTLLGTSSANQAAIFGAVVAQVPSCFDTSDVPTDSYIGGHTQISNLNPGKFQLVMQTAGKGTLGSDGKAIPGAAGEISIDLPPLATPSRIDAWASIVE
jgi:type IV pilus assembly protein PilY1